MTTREKLVSQIDCAIERCDQNAAYWLKQAYDAKARKNPAAAQRAWGWHNEALTRKSKYQGMRERV